MMPIKSTLTQELIPMKTKRDGKIEFFRFIFCMAVILFHYDLLFPLNTEKFGLPFLTSGRLGVEFFFLLSGYFLAAYAYKINYSYESLSRTTVLYTARKLSSIIPFHLFLFTLSFVVKSIIQSPKSFVDWFNWVLKSIPGFFLTIGTGVPEIAVLKDEWYISKMLLMCLILLPLLLRFRKTFARIVAPVIAIGLIGYMVYTTTILGGVDTRLFGDLIAKTTVRAFAEMALGIFIFEVVSYLKKCNLMKKHVRIISTCVEVILYCSCILIMTESDTKYEVFFLILMVMALTITLSGLSYGKTLFNHSFFYWLGRFSLPLYLSQRVIFTFFKNVDLPGLTSNYIRLPVVLGTIFILALIAQFLGKFIAKGLRHMFRRILPERDFNAIF